MSEPPTSEACYWSRGATPGVYKSTCSLVPFLHAPEPIHNSDCPYCGSLVRLVGTKVEYDGHGEVQHIK
jgi:hypothetical protein